MADSAPRKAPTRRRPKLGRPNPVDIHVGSRVRLRRMVLGLSQEKLGEQIGLTFQQIQKYERGMNRIGASRLYELSAVLDVPVQYFFGEMSEGTIGQMQEIARNGSFQLAEDPALPYQGDPLAKREVLELVRAFIRIPDPTLRHRMLELAKSLGVEANDEPSVATHLEFQPSP